MTRVLIILGVLTLIIFWGYSVWQKVSLNNNNDQSLIGQSWSQFHGSSFHTGFAAISGPRKATLKWKFQLGSQVGGDPNSVVVSADGTIYVAGAGAIFVLDK